MKTSPRNRNARRSAAPRSSSPTAPVSGRKVIDVEGLTKAMGDKLLVEDLTFSLPPGRHRRRPSPPPPPLPLSPSGPNGAGKTTLFRMLTGQEAPDAGTIDYGDTVKLRLCRPVPRRARCSAGPSEGGDLGRRRGDRPRRRAGQLPRLLRLVQLQGRRPAKEGRASLRRRAQPRPHGEAPEDRRQRPPARRTDQRPRPSRPSAPLRMTPSSNFAGCAVVISHDRFFLDRSAPTCSPSRARATWNGSRGISRPYEEDKKRRPRAGFGGA